MAQITFNVPADKVQRVIDMLKHYFPVPVDGAGDPQFTDQEWAKESIRRWLVKQVQRYERQQQIGQVSVDLDDDLLS